MRCRSSHVTAGCSGWSRSTPPWLRSRAAHGGARRRGSSREGGPGVSGRGLLDLIRERFGIGWALVAVIVILIANGGIIVSEFAGIAAAADLFGLDRLILVPLCAAGIAYLVIATDYDQIERFFLLLT